MLCDFVVSSTTMAFLRILSDGVYIAWPCQYSYSMSRMRVITFSEFCSIYVVSFRFKDILQQLIGAYAFIPFGFLWKSCVRYTLDYLKTRLICCDITASSQLQAFFVRESQV